MSLSKEQVTVKRPQQPKCSRCRHHRIIIPLKGHMKSCPFLKCDCWKCSLVTQRTRITADHRKLNTVSSKALNKDPRSSGHNGVSVVKPAVESTCRASDGGAREAASTGVMCPPSGGTEGRPAITPLNTPDLESRPAATGESSAGLDRKAEPPFSSSGAQSCALLNAPHFSEFPLPVIHFPLGMSGHIPSSYVPCPSFLLNTPWLPPIPVGLYNNRLCAPLIFPLMQYSPPPEPGPPADCRKVSFTLQPTPVPVPFQEESKQHPLPNLSTTD